MTVATKDIAVRQEGDEYFLVGDFPPMAEFALDLIGNTNTRVVRVLIEFVLSNGWATYEVIGKMDHRDTLVLRRIDRNDVPA